MLNLNDFISDYESEKTMPEIEKIYKEWCRDYAIFEIVPILPSFSHSSDPYTTTEFDRYGLMRDILKSITEWAGQNVKITHREDCDEIEIQRNKE